MNRMQLRKIHFFSAARFCGLAVLFFVLLGIPGLLGLPGGPAIWGAAGSVPSALAQNGDLGDIANFKELIAERIRKFTRLEGETGHLSKLVRDESSALDDDLDKAKAEYSTIVLERGMERYSPLEAREIYDRLRRLLDRVKRFSTPISKLQSQLSMFRDSLEATLKEVETLDQSTLEPGEQRLVSDYVRRVKSVERSLARLEKTAERNTKAVSEFREKLEGKCQELEAGIPELWTRFFFARSHFIIDLNFWQTLPGYLNFWQSMGRDQLQSYAEVPAKDYFGALVVVLFLSGLVYFAGGWLRSRINVLLVQAKLQPLRGSLRPWGLLSLGVGFSLVSIGGNTDLSGPIRLLGSILQAWGAVGTAWSIRRHFTEEPARSPMCSYLVLFSIGLVFMGTTMPNPLVCLCWGGIMLVPFLSSRKRRKIFEDYHMFGRCMAGLLPGVGVVLALLAFFGMGRFSVVLLSLVFLLAAAFLVSSATSMLLRSILSAPAESYPVKLAKGILLGVSTPLAWTLTFFAAGFWLTEHLGGFFIMRRLVDLEMNLKGFSIRVASIFIVIVLFYATRTGIAIFRDLLGELGRDWSRPKRDSISSLQVLAQYGAWSLYIIVSLYLLGISLTSLTVIAGGLSVGIGFGLQNIVNNFTSGLILLFGRSIKEGDVLQFDDVWCTVRKISFRSTTVETFDNAVLIIPNSDLITNRILNWTRNNEVVRRDVLVGVAYGSDTELVAKTLQEIADAHPHVLKVPGPNVLFDNFGASSLDFILRVWIDDIGVVLTVLSELRHSVDKAFRERDIEISFPQMDLHFRSGVVPLHVEKDGAPPFSGPAARDDEQADPAGQAPEDTPEETSGETSGETSEETPGSGKAPDKKD